MCSVIYRVIGVRPSLRPCTLHMTFFRRGSTLRERRVAGEAIGGFRRKGGG
jgi:hypothetical protein